MRLLERYCALAGVKRAAVGPDRWELAIPEPERAFFRNRASVRVAFSLDALERDPDAEIVVLGSPFASQLFDAIRARAARLSLGLIAPAGGGEGEALELGIPVRGGTARPGPTSAGVRPVGRLVARVVLRAGGGVEEAVVESDVYDLASGARVSAGLATRFAGVEAGRVGPAPREAAGDVEPVEPRAPAELVQLFLAQLRERSAQRVAARRAAAEQELAAELGRLDRYFGSVLAEQSDAAAIETVTALAQRRRAEAVRRSEVRAIVHPLQLVEATALLERAEWRLESVPPGRRHASLTVERSFGGASPWSVACPRCGRPPAELVICRHDPPHCACDACSHRCSVCGEDFCADHGIAQCRVDSQPVCDEHVRVCQVCRLQHCTAHQGTCVGGEGEHPACSACLAPCASCGRVICNRHAEESDAEAPKGKRRLCAACLRHCDGGNNEAVGVDELVQCASCGKPVCAAHAAQCAVDGQVHCSQHLRPAGEPGRLVCGRHAASLAGDSPDAAATAPGS